MAVTLKSIVVGLDGSAASWRALAVAIDVASRYEATVHACFVWSLTSTEERAGFSAAPLSAAGEGEEERRLPEAVTKELSDAGVHGDFCEREGEVARELEELASSNEADLIVVGRSRHPALHLGGVPLRLLAMGCRLVLVVP